MFRVSGFILRKQGKVLISSTHHALVEWTETTQRHRRFVYLVILQGPKYTRPVRLEHYEVEYWRKHIQQHKLEEESICLI